MHYLHMAPPKESTHHNNKACFCFIGKYRTKKSAMNAAKKLGFSNLWVSHLVNGSFKEFEKLS